jgi:hypothetical protein
VKPSNNPAALLLGVTVLLGAGCATTQPMSFPLGSRIYPPKPLSAEILLFKDTAPGRKYEPIARLNVHIEKTFFIPTAFEEARPKLVDLARQRGADAIIQVEEKKSRLNETFIYNVTATAIIFTD